MRNTTTKDKTLPTLLLITLSIIVISSVMLASVYKTMPLSEKLQLTTINKKGLTGELEPITIGKSMSYALVGDKLYFDGRLLTSDGIPIQNAQIEIHEKGSGFLFMVTTDESGAWRTHPKFYYTLMESGEHTFYTVYKPLKEGTPITMFMSYFFPVKSNAILVIAE